MYPLIRIFANKSKLSQFLHISCGRQQKHFWKMCNIVENSDELPNMKYVTIRYHNLTSVTSVTILHILWGEHPKKSHSGGAPKTKLYIFWPNDT